MDGAFGRDLDSGESADQAFSDLTGTPAAVLALHVEDIVLNLKGKLMSIAIGAPAPVGQPLNPALLVAIEDLVPGLAGDPELSAEFRHGLAGEPASHKLKSFVHHRTLLPRHLTSSHKKGKSVTHVSGTICYLCLRSLNPHKNSRLDLIAGVANAACLMPFSSHLWKAGPEGHFH